MKRIFRHIILALMAVFASVQAMCQVNADQVLAIGRNVLSMEDYMLAIQYFNLAIKAKPYLEDPYYFRALAKLELEDYKGAEEDCSKTLELNKFKVEAYKLRGFVRQIMGQDSLAVIDYDKGLEYNPRDKYFLFYKSVAQTSSSRYDAADSTFATLLRLYPNFEDGYAARANLKLQKKDTVAALADIDRALSISGNLVNAHLLRASVEADRKNWKEALVSMDEVVKLRPQEAEHFINRAYLRYNTNDFFGAMADYNFALELDPGNKTALYNRGLLRFEVRDLNHAAEDFTAVLEQEPENFHALYNRGLIYLDTHNYNKAIADFDVIMKRYPRFYPVYYAKAQAYQEMGRMRQAYENYSIAEDMVRRYVKNPVGNPLDRPTIQAGTTFDGNSADADEESQIDVMDKFNRLVTLNNEADQEPELAFNDKIKGRVQDRNMRVELEAPYGLSIYGNTNSLRNTYSHFRELDDFNRRGYVGNTLYLTSSVETPASEIELQKLFRLVDDYTASISLGKERPADYLARGVIYTILKNYPAAMADFGTALRLDPDFTIALMARAYALMTNKAAGADVPGGAAAAAMADLDAALKYDPSLSFAWYNKGCLYYDLQDFTSAIQAFTEAINRDADFGQAYYNRGLTYLRTGNRKQALADLSKAGELGIVPSYSVLKRLK